MPCYHPLRRFSIGTNEATGKSLGKIASFDTKELVYNGSIFIDSVPIPCGNCIGCRLDHSREWADRMMLESSLHSQNCFLTLTYNDDNLIFNEYFNRETGEVSIAPASLFKADLQKFLKRLRFRLDKDFDIKIRFYACGEYGSASGRPHYHAIIFGWYPHDCQYLSHRLNVTYWRSPMLEKLWPFGFVCVARMTWETCAYCARYVTKKHKGLDKSYYDINGINPEFATMSLKPGIAFEYFDLHKEEIFENDNFFLGLPSGSHKIHDVRYFDYLFDRFEYEPDARLERKLLKAEKAQNYQDAVLRNTGLSWTEYLKVCEDNFLSKARQTLSAKKSWNRKDALL